MTEKINFTSEDLKSKKSGPLKEIWKKVQALWELIKDPNAVPWAKALAISSLVYLISPVDLVPDMLPGGLVDDAGVIIATIGSLGVIIDKYIKKIEKEDKIE